jgi:hypothetical protein
MKIRSWPLALVVALLLLDRSPAFGDPTVSTLSENSMRISSAQVVRALGGGSYVTGMIEPSFGYFPGGPAHVHVAAYGREGNF